MTKEAALYQFFSSFGIEAWPGPVEAGAEFPYLTYTVQTDDFYGEPVSLTVQLWYRTSIDDLPNAKAREIAAAIGGGVKLPCDGGRIVLYRGSPWCVNAAAEGDSNVKVRQLNVTADYQTVY